MAKINFLGGKFEAFDDLNNKLAGGKVHFYEIGTTTNKDTYTNSDLDTANANPVILDSAGRATIWLSNEDYKVVLKDSNDVTIYTEDKINPVATATSTNYNLAENGSFEDGVDGDGFPLKWVTTEWGTVSVGSANQQHGAKSAKFVSTGAGGGFIQSESFLEVDDSQLYMLHWQMESTVVDVRNLVQIKFYDSAQADVSTSIIFDESAANPTSWTPKNFIVKPPSTAKYAKLEFYGAHSSDATSGTTEYDDIVFTRQYPFLNNWLKGADIASAGTLTLGTDGNYFDITGTTAITAISGDQPIVKLHFDAALILTHHATNLVMPNGANYTTAAGDEFELIQYGSGTWRVTNYSLASGKPINTQVVAGDIQAGAISEVGDFAASVVDQAAVADNAIGQGELNTATASSTTNVGTNSSASKALTGGAFSFWTMSSDHNTSSTPHTGFGNGDTAAGTIGFVNVDGSSAWNYYIDETYIQASPPYGTADGDIPLFVYVEIEKGSGNILGISAGPDPIWAYHGPTDIRAKEKRGGKEYTYCPEIIAEIGQAKFKSKLVKAIKSGDTKTRDQLRERKSTDKIVRVEVTRDFKNTDMNTHPHPWMYNKPRNSEFILLDPQNSLDLYDLHMSGEKINTLISNGDIIIDNTPLKRIVPLGMKAYGFKFR